MNITEIFKRFPTQEACIAHLEAIRWGDKPSCTYCGSLKVCRHTEKNKVRWQCQDCRSSFSVTVGTIFHNTHVELQKWFLLISLMLNAKKGLSAYQAARDIQLRRPTVWSMMHRIRNAMEIDGRFLCGVVEMDETYIGGKPRKGNKRDDDIDGGTNPRGRGTKKIPVVGMVARNGRVKAKHVSKRELNAAGFRELIREGINTKVASLITDEYRGYNNLDRLLPHVRINHSKEYARGDIHTNTIESFWAILKRGIIGQYHKVSPKYLAKYLDEFCFRYNQRRYSQELVFNNAIRGMLRV